MSLIVSEKHDDGLFARLNVGVTNVITTELLRQLLSAIDSAETAGVGVVLW